jgi:hypothetical protein
MNKQITEVKFSYRKNFNSKLKNVYSEILYALVMHTL